MNVTFKKINDLFYERDFPRIKTPPKIKNTWVSEYAIGGPSHRHRHKTRRRRWQHQ